ncbi:MAG: PhnD/SsuA/transferrin family substrate-binding protein [Rhodocyclales bacterium]|nr:PhnD/SsuA/transferrin family substrate-binding protein [Rhodocyclales bacterium]
MARLVLACTALLGLAGCDAPLQPAGPQLGDTPPPGTLPVLRFAVHPLHNPRKLAQAYQPLIDHLNEQLPGVHIELEASRDYADYELKFRRRAPEFLLPNPWHTLEAMKVGYSVIAMAGEPADFKGVIVVRRDSGIRNIVDLKGKEVSYPSATALAACVMPQWFFRAQGLDPMRDITNRYVGSQESSIMNVFLKQAAAGATWPPPWRAFQKDHPEQAAELMVAWETAPLVNNSVMVRDDVSPTVAATVRKALLALDATPAGRNILAGTETARFLPATDDSYAVVGRFVREFERRVRRVEDRK